MARCFVEDFKRRSGLKSISGLKNGMNQVSRWYLDNDLNPMGSKDQIGREEDATAGDPVCDCRNFCEPFLHRKITTTPPPIQEETCRKATEGYLPRGIFLLQHTVTCAVTWMQLPRGTHKYLEQKSVLADSVTGSAASFTGG